MADRPAPCWRSWPCASVLGPTGAAANVMLGASRERAVARVFIAEAVVSVTAVLLLV